MFNLQFRSSRCSYYLTFLRILPSQYVLVFIFSFLRQMYYNKHTIYFFYKLEHRQILSQGKSSLKQRKIAECNYNFNHFK